MEYLDFVLSEVHGIRIKELQDAKAWGKKIVGTFCVFVPEEMVLAGAGIPMLANPLFVHNSKYRTPGPARPADKRISYRRRG